LQRRNLDQIASYFCYYVADIQSLVLPTQSQYKRPVIDELISKNLTRFQKPIKDLLLIN